MIETRKDIFGNVYRVETNPMPYVKNNYKQRLNEQKQKDAYKKYMAAKRKEQIQEIKTGLHNTNQFVRATGNLTQRTGQRLITATRERVIQNPRTVSATGRLYQLIKGRPKSIYPDNK